MTTQGSFNTKNPTIKRLLKEAAELSTVPSSDYAATPLETNLFEWHFTLKGPPASSYANGIYHGRIVLPPTYPLRPPSFRFLTPSGRFEVNREICLSISGHHEESWQPAWGIRTALVAIRSFMESDAKGQLGGIDTSAEVRNRFARESRTWTCPVCGGRTNEDIMLERTREVEQLGRTNTKEETIPEELNLAYRDELEKKVGAEPAPKPDEGMPTASTPTTKIANAEVAGATEVAPLSTLSTMSNAPQAPGELRSQRHRSDTSHWLDVAIAFVGTCLFVFVLRKLARIL